MITADDVKKRLNKIFQSDKWIVYEQDNYFDFPIIWVKIEGKTGQVLILGYIKKERNLTELDRILSKALILKNLIAFRIIRKKYKIVKKTA